MKNSSDFLSNFAALKEEISHCSMLVKKRMSDLLPRDFSDSKLVEAMRYTCLSEGKKLRPFLLIKSAEIFQVPKVSSLNAAAALEFVHCYSLIHDDLPAMDDDDFRRGQASSHKKYDEATAILAGDSLLTYAFEILSNSTTHKNPNARCHLITTLAKCAGFKGMAGGQMLDIEKKGKKITKEQIATLHRQKTGELFIAACEMGATLGVASKSEREKLRYFAHDFGLAFQICDDIIDHKENKNKATKDNTSIVETVGLENAILQLDLLKSQAKIHLKSIKADTQIFCDLVDYAININR